MSLTDFFHGVETVTVTRGPRPIQTVRSSVIGLIGTAPDANLTKFPLNQPVLLNRRSDANGLGTKGTLPEAIDSIFDQIGALVTLINVPPAQAENVQLGNVIGGIDPVTGELLGVHAFRKAESVLGVSPMLLVAPGFTHIRPRGVSGHVVEEAGENYTAATVKFTGGGEGAVMPTATVNLAAGRVTGLSFRSVGYGITAPITATIEGDGTGAVVTVQIGPAANPVIGEFLPIADGLKAHIIADGPSTTDADAIAHRDDWGSRRVFIVDPHIEGWSQSTDTYVLQPASSRVAGHIARVDNNFGFWESPSNKEVYGIGGLLRPIDYAFGHKNSRANLLNEQCIATFVRDDGWYLWGNRTASVDPDFAFLSVSRTADMVDISIAKAHRWAVDRGITKAYFEDVSSSVRAYLRNLRTRGAILGGDCWVDPEFNTEVALKGGNATFSYDFTPVYTAERLTFRSHLVSDYVSNLFNQGGSE
jgi:phage tail sheath protein FI